MAEKTFNSNDYEIQTSENNQSSNLNEFREMMDVALNLDVSADTNNDETSIDEQSINQALLSLDICDDNRQINRIHTNTAVSVAELPSGITDSLNVAAKQLSLLYESVVNVTTTEQEEDSFEDTTEREDEIASSFVKPCSEQQRVQFQSSSTTPKPTTHTMTSGNQQQKRHIMISYNRSSRETCQKIYDRLVERNYKVWMDLTDMGDDILVSMARAVEDSYIVLLCINQKYYESDYCRLEAEYAAENRIKFIPCLMEQSFRAQSWLGIIKELIRQITYVEKKLSLQPRRTPAPSSMVNPMKLVSMSTSHATAATHTNDVNSRRFDDIIREYKQSIKKKRHQLTRLKRNELSDLIVKLRQELFTETSQVLTDSDRSDEEDEKQHNDNHLLEQLLGRTLDQNDLLLRLVDRLTTPQPTQQNNTHNLDINAIFKVILAIMLLWALHLLYRKE
ncbi:unnamed protein product [Rotaria sordida]|uniref:TIR domain-containing protein n=1 Tax=Rotaria sordida TaxID=392033 RepID=A0A815PD78_9BILA|nr:unnamed protein product [Rotaria sordida]